MSRSRISISVPDEYLFGNDPANMTEQQKADVDFFMERAVDNQRWVIFSHVWSLIAIWMLMKQKGIEVTQS